MLYPTYFNHCFSPYFLPFWPWFPCAFRVLTGGPLLGLRQSFPCLGLIEKVLDSSVNIRDDSELYMRRWKKLGIPRVKRKNRPALLTYRVRILQRFRTVHYSRCRVCKIQYFCPTSANSASTRLACLKLVERDYSSKIVHTRTLHRLCASLPSNILRLRCVWSRQADVSGPHVCQRPHPAGSDLFGSVARAVLIPDAMEWETVPAVHNCWNHPNHLTLIKE